MENRAKRWILLLLMAVALAIMLEPLGALAPDGNVELTLGVFVGSNWAGATRYGYRYIDDLIERFEQQNPNLHVVYRSGTRKDDYTEWLSEQILKGTAPDVFVVLNDSFETLSSIGALHDLRDAIRRDPDFDQTRYYPSVLEMGQMNGVQYAMPSEVVPTIMLVNETLLEANGFDLSELPWNWDTFYEICQKLTCDTDKDGFVDQFGVADYTWDLAVYTNGQELFQDGKPCLTKNQIFDAISYYQKLLALNKGQKPTQDKFERGEVGFLVTDFSTFLAQNAYPYRLIHSYNFRWSCIPLPAGPDNPDMVTAPTEVLMYGISSNTAHFQEAWELLKFITYDAESQLSQLSYSNVLSAQKALNLSDATHQVLEATMGDAIEGLDLLEISGLIERSMTQPNFIRYSEAFSMIDSRIRSALYEQSLTMATLIGLQRNVENYLSS